MIKSHPRILFATTASISAELLRPLYERLGERGIDFLLMSGQSDDASGANPNWIHVDMVRAIAPKTDIRSFAQILSAMRKRDLDVVVYGTPKASLLVSLVSTILRIPTRIFVLHGLRHETLRGPSRWFVLFSDFVSARLSTTTVCVSPSLLETAVSSKIVNPDKSRVFGGGSVVGIDSQRFRPALAGNEAPEIRIGLGLDVGATVVGYVGRLARDKGIEDLVSAARSLRMKHPELMLLLVGDDDPTDQLPEAIRTEIDTSPHVIRLGSVAAVERIYRAMDIFVLPTYREGLGLVALEAAASGVAVVTTTVTGARDTVLHMETGLCVAPRSPTALAEAIDMLIVQPDLSVAMGVRGREFVVSKFAPGERMDAWETLLGTRSA